MKDTTFEPGDKVEITVAEPKFFEVGDKATLVSQDEDGDWLAEFDDRSWANLPGDLASIEGQEENHLFCLQKGFSEFKLVA